MVSSDGCRGGLGRITVKPPARRGGGAPVAITQPASEHPQSGQRGSMHNAQGNPRQHPKLATGTAAGGYRAHLAAGLAHLPAQRLPWLFRGSWPGQGTGAPVDTSRRLWPGVPLPGAQTRVSGRWNTQAPLTTARGSPQRPWTRSCPLQRDEPRGGGASLGSQTARPRCSPARFQTGEQELPGPLWPGSAVSPDHGPRANSARVWPQLAESVSTARSWTEVWVGAVGSRCGGHPVCSAERGPSRPMVSTPGGLPGPRGQEGEQGVFWVLGTGRGLQEASDLPPPAPLPRRAHKHGHV